MGEQIEVDSELLGDPTGIEEKNERIHTTDLAMERNRPFTG